MERRIECVLPFRAELIGNTRLPAIHGGVIGSFLELTALLRLIDESGLASVPRADQLHASTTCARPARVRRAPAPRSSSSAAASRTSA